MSDWVIKAEGLSKKFRKGSDTSYKTLRDSVNNAFKRNVHRNETRDQEFWALKDLHFEVKEGEVLGIIGRNGAGKSTLLKVISRITEPTDGRLQIKGRVGSLLEVGTGFHPELTGRENIFMNGAVLGLTKQEIRAKFDEIVDFSGVEEFLDTPVKRYSSGMTTRLGFSVAAHLEPEILIVDEVLSVGDSFFRKKCLGKMRDVAKGGRTVLYVSHNLSSVRNLCSRALLLDHGKIELDKTEVGEVISAYLEGSEGRSGGLIWQSDKKISSGGLHLESFYISDENGHVPPSASFSGCDHRRINIVIRADIPLTDLTAGFALYLDDGTMMTWSNIRDHKDFDWTNIGKGKIHLSAQLPTEVLNDGNYRAQLFFSLPHSASILTLQNSEVVLKFSVSTNNNRSANWVLNQRTDWAPVIKWEARNYET